MSTLRNKREGEGIRDGEVARCDMVEGDRERTRDAQLAEAVAQAGEGVVITDVQGTIQYVNPAFTAMTGYSAAEVVGQNPRILKSGEQDPGFYTDLWQTILRGEIWHGQLINRRKDGVLYAEEMTIAPVRDRTGSITSFVAVKRDELSLPKAAPSMSNTKFSGRMAAGSGFTTARSAPLWKMGCVTPTGSL